MQNILIMSPGRGPESIPRVIDRLNEAGHAVVRAALDDDERESLHLLSTAFEGRPPDLVIADLTTSTDTLPLRHLSRLLRQLWGDDMPLPPRLMLAPRVVLSSHGWEAHADDFVLAPYAEEEILSRIRLLFFRKRHLQTCDTLNIGGLTLDLASGRAIDDGGNDGGLTPREFDLLRFLATHRGKFFPRERLLDMVWGVDFDGGERTVDIHIRRLRAKLPEQVGSRIETRRGLGYGLVGN